MNFSVQYKIKASRQSESYKVIKNNSFDKNEKEWFSCKNKFKIKAYEVKIRFNHTLNKFLTCFGLNKDIAIVM